MKKNKKFIVWLLIIVMIFSISGCKSKDENNGHDQKQEQNQEIDLLSFADEIFFEEISTDTLSLHFTIAHPENFGIELFQPTLGEYSVTQTKESYNRCKEYLAKLKTYNYKELNEKEQLIYDILEDALTVLLDVNENPYLYEGLGPTTGFQAQLPVLLAEYTFYDKEDVTDYLLLLQDIKRYFSEVAEFEREKSNQGYFMSDDIADEIMNQCSTFIENPTQNLLISCFNEKIEQVKDLSKDEITLLMEENRDTVLNYVIPAYQIIIDTLNELKGTGKNSKGLAGFDGGSEYYEALAKQKTGSSKSVKEMKKALEKELNNCMKLLSSMLNTDSTIEEQYTTYQFPSNDPNEIMEYLNNAISADFPVLDKVDYSLKYVHTSLQDFLSPAMYLIPPIDDYNNNNIYINQNPSYDPSELFPTVAHEGYPGHLYQTVYFRQTNPELIQSLLSTSGYVEGWGLYAERFSYAYAGFSENLTLFLQSDFIANHCLYSLSDIGINYEGWTKEEHRNFWATYQVSADIADEIFGIMVAEPCVYLPYAIGYLEFAQLRVTAENALDKNFNTKEFHTFLMDLGPAPFSVIEKELNEWIGAKK